MKRILFTALFAVVSSAFGEGKKSSLDDQISFYSGYLYWKWRKNEGTHKLTLKEFLKGAFAADRGEPIDESQLKTVEEFLHVHAEEIWKHKCEVNIRSAEQYLKELEAKNSIQCIKPGKLYIEVLAKGTAAPKHPAYVYEVRGLDNGIWTLLDTQKEATHIDLDIAIEGMTLGIEGMKDGERRILYIHPELAYGEYGTLTNVPPQCTLKVEVECIDSAH